MKDSYLFPQNVGCCFVLGSSPPSLFSIYWKRCLNTILNSAFSLWGQRKYEPGMLFWSVSTIIKIHLIIWNWVVYNQTTVQPNEIMVESVPSQNKREIIYKPAKKLDCTKQPREHTIRNTANKDPITCYNRFLDFIGLSISYTPVRQPHYVRFAYMRRSSVHAI
mgnify:FL=1